MLIYPCRLFHRDQMACIRDQFCFCVWHQLIDLFDSSDGIINNLIFADNKKCWNIDAAQLNLTEHVGENAFLRVSVAKMFYTTRKLPGKQFVWVKTLVKEPPQRVGFDGQIREQAEQ